MLTQPGRTIWVEVEDLFEYFIVNPRPSGIQRLAYELMRELVRTDAVIRFLRRATGVAGVREVPWDEVQALFAARPAPASGSVATPPVATAGLHAVWRRLPAAQRQNVRKAMLLQKETNRNVRVLLGMVRGSRPASRPVPAAVPSAGVPLQAGDTLLVLGAPWAVPGFPDHLRYVKDRYGVVVTLLLYDLIPVRNPEWCTRFAVDTFAGWLHGTLPLCDRLMAISRHTAEDVEAYAREEGIPLPGPVAVVPVGTGFSDVAERAPGTAPTARPPGLPRPGSYVLFVSTLERRKNHALLFRVWRRLAEDLRTGRRAPGSVPTLVFAGRVGWLVSDLMTQLDNTGWLGGRVRLVRDPTDDELRALYAGCLFTVLPSLSEGWGLPLTESLAVGKPCLAAATTALPEAGGDLCRYFDPDDTSSAYRAVVHLLDHPGAVAAWEEEVRRSFRPTPWADTARAVLGHAASAGAVAGAARFRYRPHPQRPADPLQCGVGHVRIGLARQRIDRDGANRQSAAGPGRPYWLRPPA